MKKLLLLPILALAIGIFLFRPTDEPAEPVLATESVQVPVVEEKPVEQPEKPTVERLLELTNAEREKVGVKPLMLDERLIQSAQKKCEDMAITDDWNHILKNGLTPKDYIVSQGIQYQEASEILAINYTSDISAVEGWMKSETHMQTVIGNVFEDVGFGICTDDGQYSYVGHYISIN